MRSAASPLRSGFTLVELSIVLVIIGLLLGGVLIGKDMIRSAQLRSVATDVQGYIAAAQLFQDKYNCLPGDCANATTYWSGVTNGNGNGALDVASAANAPGEIFGAWQQLALAGYIKGTYNGLAGSLGTDSSFPGTNVPTSKIPNAGYSWYYLSTITAWPSYYNGDYKNILFFGAKVTSGSSPTNSGIITPSEAYAIDQKFDDGIPGIGNIRSSTNALSSTTANCSTAGSTATNPLNSAYNVSGYSAIACDLIFISGW